MLIIQATNTWSQVASVPLYNSPWGLEGTDAATTGLDGTIYAFSAGWATPQVSAYNQTTNTWTQIASHLYSAYGKAATTGLDGTIYIMGGYATNYAAVSEVDAYTPVVPVTPTVNVIDNGGTYNATAFVATATVNGQASLEGVTPTLDYQQLVNGSWHDLGANAPVNAGSYDVTANFAGSTDYAAVSSNPPTLFSIMQATATVNVTPYSVTYDGNAHTATATATGINNLALPSSDLNLAGTTHTNVGTYYSDTVTFSDPNYYPQTYLALGDTIGLASTTVLTSSSNSSVYGQSVTFTATVTPSSGTGSTPTGMVTFYDNGVPCTNGIDPFTNTPTPVNVQLIDGVATFTPYNGTGQPSFGSASNMVVGTNSITAVYNGTMPYMGGSDPPYGPSTSAAITQVVTKADPDVYIYQKFLPPNGNLTYNGTLQSPTWTTSNANDPTTYMPVPGVYNITAPEYINAGTYTDASYTFTPTDTTDYNTITGSLSWTLNQASPTINVTPYNVTYDGQQHTATGTVTGVNGESLTGLSLTGTVHTNAGVYADSWTFTDPTGNYSSASSTDYRQPAVFDIINRASVTANIVPFNTTYDGQAHSATVNIVGVNGQLLTTITTAPHVYAGIYSDAWTFNDPANNYIPESGTAVDIISKADAKTDVINPPVALITTLYLEILDRTPDTAGLTCWVNTVNSGATVSQIATSFWNSPEHKANPIGSLTAATHDADTAFVTALYQDMLGRTGDQAGITGWTLVLDNNSAITPNQVAMDFWNSAEHQADLKAGTAPTSIYGVVVGALYNDLLGRSPDVVGLNTWVNALYSGAMTQDQMVQGFANSAEFVAKTSSLSTNQFVTRLYNQILNRAPDASGLVAWGQESGTGPILLNWAAPPTSERSSTGRGILISAHPSRATRGTIGRL